MIQEINELLRAKKDLNVEQVNFAMEEILEGRMDENELGLFITLLHDKGETSDELYSLVQTMWSHCPDVSGVDVTGAIDTCGTGGDQLGTFNISTAVSILLSSVGVKVAKHGNRAASSKCGAADVLEALNIPVDLNLESVIELFNTTGYAFLYAPLFHSGMRHAAPVRKALGVPTTFNFLGPLANPFHAPIRIHGVSKPEILKTYIETLKKLGVQKAIVFHGAGGIDEISLTGTSYGFRLENDLISEFQIDPFEYGFEKVEFSELVGGDAIKNAEIIRKIFDGEKSGKSEIVTINAAVALDLVKGGGIQTCIEEIRSAIDAGMALRKLDEISAISVQLKLAQS